MLNTYKALKPLATKLRTAEDRSNENFNRMALEYQVTQDQHIFATIFCEMFPYLIKNRDTFPSYVNEADIGSYSLESLHNALMNFDPSKGAGIRTLYVRFLRGKFREHASLMGNQVRCANNNAVSLEMAIMEGKLEYEEGRYSGSELLESIKQAEGISPTEIKYCELVMNPENFLYSDSDIAKMLGITPAAVNYIKKSLARKLTRMEIAYA
jgi:DNA-directed RNA polymerase specialized sigma subunit